ncbi:hypothetical protein H9Q10_04100 [Eikenella sp. S3360]|uniref:Uncharacterized protein n=2 Tax=Eikenella glucosivorans TaxID=2766967 RepID=A0ABS0N979_9NEIS|nr:hypothetical protein [Eikenella glucosivorans]
MLTFVILMIPLVNLVMVVVWAIGAGGTNPSKANFFRAYLLLCAIVVVLAFGIMAIVGYSLNQ